MTGHTWDPARYLAYAGERGRPFVDLLARVGADEPARVVDLGCGAGNLTALLAERWPRAEVTGLDSSAEMVAAAREAAPGITVEVADLRDWRPERPVDVLLSNAVLQWVPGHLDLLPRLVSTLAPGGWLALQVPGNLGQPSHVIARELAAEEPYAAHTADGAWPDAQPDPADYLRALTALGCEVDAWETTYLHVLRGEDPVFTWLSGTGVRPTLQALPDGLRDDFAAELKRRLPAAYPTEQVGKEPAVIFPFRRVFVVARAPAATHDDAESEGDA